MYICLTILSSAAPEKVEKEEEKEKKEEPEPEKIAVPSVEKKPPVTTASPKARKKSPVSKTPKSAPNPPPKRRLSSTPSSSTKNSKKSSSQDKAKKQGPPPPPIPVFSTSGPPGSRIHPTGALSVHKSTFTIPKKHSQTPGVKESSVSGPSPTAKKPPVSVPTATTKNQPAVSKPVQSSVSALPPQPPPNNQMRSNIRRSLTDILYKRWEFTNLVFAFIISIFFSVMLHILFHSVGFILNILWQEFLG